MSVRGFQISFDAPEMTRDVHLVSFHTKDSWTEYCSTLLNS